MSRGGLAETFPTGRKKASLGPWAQAEINKGQRIGRVREAEWVILHGKAHKGRKVDVENWADGGDQFALWVHGDVWIRWLQKAGCGSLVL